MLFEVAEIKIDEDEIYSKVLSSKGGWLREASRDNETTDKKIKRSKPVSGSSNISVKCTKKACGNSKKRKTHCVWHMTETLLKDIIDEALEKRITDKVEFIMENEARKMADREFMLSVDNRWGDEGFLRCNTFFNVQEGVKKRRRRL